MSVKNDHYTSLQTWCVSHSHIGFRLANAKFLTADDYFAAFVDPAHDNFVTETNRAAVQLMGEIFDHSGSKISAAPNDFIDHFLAGHEGIFGEPEEVLDGLLEISPLTDGTDIRLAVKFSTGLEPDTIQKLVRAEEAASLKPEDVLSSPLLFVRFLCHIMHIDSDPAIISELGVLSLCYGAKILRTPAWRNERASAVLLLTLTCSSRDQTELRSIGTEPLTVQGAEKTLKAPPSELTEAANDTEFLSEWRLDNYMHHYLLNARDWAQDDKVLDVGCGYSMLPCTLAEDYGVEMWAVDDTDLSGWSRQYLDNHQISNKVNYLQELVGKPETSTLPTQYFDVIYSKVAVHFSPLPQDNVYRHIKALLSPNIGSEIILLIGTASPFESNPNKTLEKMTEINVLEDKAQEILLSGHFNAAFWRDIEMHTIPRLISPFLYCAYIMNVMDVSGFVPNELRARTYFSNTDTFYDAFYTPALNACYRRDPSQLSIATTHTGAMAVRLKYG